MESRGEFSSCPWCYTVRCEFPGGDVGTSTDWLNWLQHEHIQEVIDGGADGAEVVRIAEKPPTFEVRYRFPDRSAFQNYLSRHATRLRNEGLARFPLEMGLAYSRTDGPLIFQLPVSR